MEKTLILNFPAQYERDVCTNCIKPVPPFQCGPCAELIIILHNPNLLADGSGIFVAPITKSVLSGKQYRYWVTYDSSILEDPDYVLRDCDVKQVCCHGCESKYMESYVNKHTNSACSVSVKAFGALGDGEHDDTQAFIEAIAAANYICVPEGVYIISSTLTLPSNITIFGVGIGLSVIKQADDANLSNIFTASSKEFIHLRDLTFDGNSAENTTKADGIVEFISCTDFTVKDCEIKNVIGDVSTGVALRLGTSANRFNLVNNYIHDCGIIGGVAPCDGIYACGFNGNIQGNRLVNCADTGIVFEGTSLDEDAASDNSQIIGNSCIGCGSGIAVDAGILNTFTAGVSIVGNTIEGTLATNGGSIYVFTNGQGTGKCRRVVISSNVIRNVEDGHGIFLNEVEDVTVIGNVLDSISPDEAKHGINVYLSNRVTVVGNLVREAGAYGIEVQGSSDVIVNSNSVFDSNQVGGGSSAGIDVRKVGSVQAENVTLIGNQSTGPAAAYGIQLADTTTAFVGGNDLRGNATGGLNNASAGYVRILPNATTNTATDAEVSSSISVLNTFRHTGTLLGVYGATPVAQQTINGSRGGNAALADLLTKLALEGFIIDNTSA